MINSDYMKIIVASYYRYKRGYDYTCTEWNNMDVCACDGKNIIEIECKITKSDLKKELTSKTKIKKHKYYLEVNHKREYIPNKYYIAITSKMYQDKECLEIINKINPKYGVIEISNNSNEPFIFRKHAKKIHDKNITDKEKKLIIKRISSENILLRIKLYKSKKNDAD